MLPCVIHIQNTCTQMLQVNSPPSYNNALSQFTYDWPIHLQNMMLSIAFYMYQFTHKIHDCLVWFTYKIDHCLLKVNSPSKYHNCLLSIYLQNTWLPCVIHLQNTPLPQVNSPSRYTIQSCLNLPKQDVITTLIFWECFLLETCQLKEQLNQIKQRK
jgi:hypothetical protein